MSSDLLNITVDCADPGRVARFWAAVTGWPVQQENPKPEYSLGPSREGGVRLYFVPVPEPKVVKNRLHLDLVPRESDQQQEIARLVALGASVIGGQPPDAGWVILADPEGNEFCLEGGGQEPA